VQDEAPAFEMWRLGFLDSCVSSGMSETPQESPSTLVGPLAACRALVLTALTRACLGHCHWKLRNPTVRLSKSPALSEETKGIYTRDALLGKRKGARIGDPPRLSCSQSHRHCNLSRLVKHPAWICRLDRSDMNRCYEDHGTERLQDGGGAVAFNRDQS